MNRPGLARLAAYAAVVLAGAGGMWRVETTARQAHDIANQQRETRSKVLCPLYEVFVASDTPARRAATPKDQLPAYEHAMDVIHAGAVTLDCAFLNR